MSKTRETELTHKQFWSHMEKNSTVVERMPAWVKGSPINQRRQEPGKTADQPAVLKSSPATGH